MCWSWPFIREAPEPSHTLEQEREWCNSFLEEFDKSKEEKMVSKLSGMYIYWSDCLRAAYPHLPISCRNGYTLMYPSLEESIEKTLAKSYLHTLFKKIEKN